MTDEPAMLDEAERLDEALNRRRIGASLDGLAPGLRALVGLAGEVGDACSGADLSSAERARIYASAWERLEAAQRRPLRWRRLSGRRAAVLGSAAAVTAVAAAIGIRALVLRHGHRAGLAPA
jgi:hypothetical protein